ncbi:hypothetical protein, partial [Staphylococcus aureus]
VERGKFGATTLDEGDIGFHLAKGELPEKSEAADANGFASGALAYDFDLPAGATKKVVLAVPFHGTYDKKLVGMAALQSR